MLRKIISRMRRLPDDTSGVVMLETVLVFPIQLLFLMLILQFAEYFAASAVVQYSAYQAARTYVTNSSNEATAKSSALTAAWLGCSMLNNDGTGSGSITVAGGHRYTFEEYNSKRMTLKFSKTPGAIPGQEIIEMHVEFYFKLMVPLGGDFLFKCTPTDRRGKGASGGKYMLIKRSYPVPKLWPG